jgi:hypothetical protein
VWALGLTAYALVFTREVPVAYAAEMPTDCSADLDQPDTTYLLSGNVTGNCVIAADNIILDGQDLYTISGSVAATDTVTVNFTVRNVAVDGNVYIYNAGFDIEAGDITVEHATIGGYVQSYSTDTGTITVTDSAVGGHVMLQSYYGGDTGNIMVTDSEVEGGVFSAGLNTGGITITDSHIQGTVAIESIQNTGDISIVRSEVEGYGVGTAAVAGTAGDVSVVDSTMVLAAWVGSLAISGVSGDVTVENSTISMSDSRFGSTDGTLPGEGTVTVTNSHIIGNSRPYGDTCIITDSILDAGATNCTTLTLTDNPPELTVTPLSLELDLGDSFNPFSGVSADDVVDGDLSDDVILIGSVAEEAGVYELIYSVTDHGTILFNTADNATSTSGPSTASTTRTVTRLAAESQSNTESTRVGQRSSSRTETVTPSTDDVTQTLDETLNELRIVLAQPVATNDPEVLKKLLELLTQLMAVLWQLVTKIEG